MHKYLGSHGVIQSTQTHTHLRPWTPLAYNEMTSLVSLYPRINLGILVEYIQQQHDAITIKKKKGALPICRLIFSDGYISIQYARVVDITHVFMIVEREREKRRTT